ncbi:MAG: GIY-YIG nuclease family protein [Bacteroidia bacterium]
MKIHQYFVYILTNYGKTVYYTGVTNNLDQRLADHYFNRGNTNTFTGRYGCFYLLHYEIFKYILKAIEREKEIKGWSRLKKVWLIKQSNPDLQFLNYRFLDWPPGEFWGREKAVPE